MTHVYRYAPLEGKGDPMPLRSGCGPLVGREENEGRANWYENRTVRTHKSFNPGTVELKSLSRKEEVGEVEVGSGITIITIFVFVIRYNSRNAGSNTPILTILRHRVSTFFIQLTQTDSCWSN